MDYEGNGAPGIIRRVSDYSQRLRKDRRSNWVAGFAGIATIAATVSMIGLFVEGSQYQAHGISLYSVLMLPVVWWLSGLGRFEPHAVRLWKPVLPSSVVIAVIALTVAVENGDWGPEAVGLAMTLLGGVTSLVLFRGSLVGREEPAR